MVADTAMSAKTQNILAQTGFPWAFHTARDAIGEVIPGCMCTSTALTADTYDVELPDGANDIMSGVALRNPEHDIDTAYNQLDEFELALVGGGHLVWGRLEDSSVGKFGTKLAGTVAGDGRLVSITEAAVIEQCAIQFNETATIAAEQPVLAILIPG
jgi:hypothetical protein